MNYVAPLDLAWLLVESPDTPMHVGVLQIFSPPDGCQPADFCRQTFSAWSQAQCGGHPFNLRARRQGLKSPEWVPVEQLDLERHLQAWSLTRAGSDDELGELVGRLFAAELDMTLPPWETHLIEGLQKNRFGVLTKVHHSLTDGVGGIHIMRRHLSASPTQLDMPPPWAPADRPAAAAPGEGLSLASAWHAVQQQLRALPELGRSVRRMLEAAKAHDRHHLTSPYSAPRSSLNQTVSAQRKTATLKLPLEQLHHLAQASRTSINDVLLCLCSGALRAYLLPKDSLPDEPLTAGVPVSLRANGDEKMGTAVSFMIANLATDVSCPAQRLREIHVSTRLAKQNLQGMSQLALNEYTLMLMAPMMLGLLARSSGRLRHPFNLIISNVLGPEEFLYYNGARLEEMYPFSIVTDGQALNITALSYAGHLHVGLTACAQTIPDLDSLAVAMHKEYSLLERLYRAASCPLLEAGTAAIEPG